HYFSCTTRRSYDLSMDLQHATSGCDRAGRRVTVIEDEDLLMAVLNSAPVIDGTLTDQLDRSEGVELPERLQEVGTDVERLHLRRTRDVLQAVIRGEDDAIEDLATILDRVALLPTATSDGLQWHLDVPAEERLAARAVLAWSRVVEALPGRLRTCANTECNRSEEHTSELQSR